MSPSYMELQIGTILNHNNETVIVTNSQSLGLDKEVNAISKKSQVRKKQSYGHE